MNAQAKQTLDALRNGQYDTLQQQLAALQRDFETGRTGERELLAAFQAFQKPDPSLGEKFSEWMNAHPDSYAPHVALANWFLSCAWEERGATTSNLVSDRGWRGLHHFLDQAEGCARHATTLTANPLAAWVTVGRAALARGCSLTLEDVQTASYPDWFTEPLKDNPHSLDVRRTMLMYLRTEWGGSEEQMLTFVRQQETAGLSSADMQRLWAQLHQQVSHHAHAFANNPKLAVERAELAANLRELEAGQLLVALTTADRPQLERRAALDRYLTALEREPDAEPNANLYWALYNASDWMEPLLPRVVGMLQTQIARGNDEAAVALGLLKIINRRWELPDPVPALRAARDAGNREAAETIVQLQEVGLGLKAALQTTPEKRADIMKAADLGSDEMSWRVYESFEDYRKQFELDDRAKYRYLLRAADAGNNDARYALAQQLRAGFVEVGEDGVLRPVDTQPLQESLDYAKHLLERAAAEEHKRAGKELAKTKDADWQAKTAKRLKMTSVVAEREESRGGMPWWRWLMWIWLFGVLVRSCGALLGGN